MGLFGMGGGKSAGSKAQADAAPEAQPAVENQAAESSPAFESADAGGETAPGTEVKEKPAPEVSAAPEVSETAPAVGGEAGKGPAAGEQIAELLQLGQKVLAALEEQGKRLDRLEENAGTLRKNLDETAQKVAETAEKAERSARIDEILDSQHAELEKWRLNFVETKLLHPLYHAVMQAYDLAVSANRVEGDERQLSELHSLPDRLEGVLYNMGCERFRPDSGTTVPASDARFEVVERIAAEDEGSNKKIARVISDGFVRVYEKKDEKGEDVFEYVVMRPARVTMYYYAPKTEEKTQK